MITRWYAESKTDGSVVFIRVRNGVTVQFTRHNWNWIEAVTFVDYLNERESMREQSI